MSGATAQNARARRTAGGLCAFRRPLHFVPAKLSCRASNQQSDYYCAIGSCPAALRLTRSAKARTRHSLWSLQKEYIADPRDPANTIEGENKTDG